MANMTTPEPCLPCAAQRVAVLDKPVRRRGLIRGGLTVAVVGMAQKFLPGKVASAATICGSWTFYSYRTYCYCPCGPSSGRLCREMKRRKCWPQGCEECWYYEYALFSVSGCVCISGCSTGCGGYVGGCQCQPF